MYSGARRLTSIAGAVGLIAAAAVMAAPANAGGWTIISNALGTSIWACKTPVSSIYGPLWRVNSFAVNQSADSREASVGVFRNSGTTRIHRWAVHLAPRQTSGVGTVYMSRLLDDTLQAGVESLTVPWGSGGAVNIDGVAYC